MTEGGKAVGWGVGPGFGGASNSLVQPPVATGHGFTGQWLIGGKGRAVELDPGLGQQLALAPAAVALHQQADASQVTGGHIRIGRANKGAAGIGFPHRRGDPQRLKQSRPGVVGIRLCTDHAL